MRAASIVLLIVFTALCGCGGVKSKKITEANKGKIFEEIKNSHDLTVEEVGLLQAYVIRTSLQDAFAGRQPSIPVGKTVGQVIEDQRTFMKQAADEARQDSLRAASARAEEERQQAILRQAVTVTVFEKGLSRGEYESSMMCKVSMENHSGKDIRGFQGSLVFRDLFGDQVIRFGLKEDEVLKAGQSRRVTRYWDYNQFMDDHNRWVGTKLENMKIAWEPKTVLFTDGSSLQAGEQ